MGKELVMSKSKFKPSKQMIKSLGNKEVLIGKLHESLKSGKLDEKSSKTTVSLLSQHSKKGFLTRKQWLLVSGIIKRSKKEKVELAGKSQYLYAITDGDSIKLGMTANIKQRLKDLQTANSKELFIMWKLYIGKCSLMAQRAEKKLHKRCDKYHIKGEWFNPLCFKLVESFKVND